MYIVYIYIYIIYIHVLYIQIDTRSCTYEYDYKSPWHKGKKTCGQKKIWWESADLRCLHLLALQATGMAMTLLETNTPESGWTHSASVLNRMKGRASFQYGAGDVNVG